MNQPHSRSMRFLIFFGLLLVVVSTAGAIFALNPGPTGRETGTTAAVPASGKSLVCYGFVDVEGGITSLFPLQPGRVAEVCVKENEFIADPKLKPLLKLDDRLAQHRLEQARADLAASEIQLALTKKELVEQHQLKLEQQDQAIAAIKKELEAGEETIKRKKELVAIKSISEKDVAIAEALLGKLKAALRAEELKRDELKLDRPETAQKRAEQDVAAKRAKVEEAEYGVRECVLWAPGPGTVLQVLVNPGTVLSGQAMQPAVVFLPDKPLIVRAEVEQEFAARLSVNQPVSVQEENSSKSKWSGSIKDMAAWYAQRRNTQADTLRISNDVHTLECIISLWKDEKTREELRLQPGQPELRVGQRVRVVIGKE